MIQIPSNELEQYLTDWIGVQLRSGAFSGEDEKALELLRRIPKAQMVQRNRFGEGYTGGSLNSKHSTLNFIKWLTALICAITVLIITIKVCLRRLL